MNKNVKTLLAQVLNDEFEKKGFKYFKKENIFLKEVEGGSYFIEFHITDDYDSGASIYSRVVEIDLFVNFDLINKWFEKYEYRSKSDLKFNWIHGVSLNELCPDPLKINLKDETSISRFSQILKTNVSLVYSYFYNSKNISKLWNEKLKNDSSENIINIFQVLQLLTFVWLFDKVNFNDTLKKNREKLQESVKIGEPMSLKLFPYFEEMIQDLKAHDFESEIFELDADVFNC